MVTRGVFWWAGVECFVEQCIAEKLTYACYGILWCDVVWCGVVWHDVDFHWMVWDGMVWDGMAWGWMG